MTEPSPGRRGERRPTDALRRRTSAALAPKMVRRGVGPRSDRYCLRPRPDGLMKAGAGTESEGRMLIVADGDGLGHPVRRRLRTVADRIAALPLHHRFAMAGSVVTLIGMLVIGSLVSRSIETSVVRNSAISSAVYMESFIAPMSQELAEFEAPVRPDDHRAHGGAAEPAAAVGACRFRQDMAAGRAARLQQRCGPDRPALRTERRAHGGLAGRAQRVLRRAGRRRERRASAQPACRCSRSTIRSTPILTGEIIAVAEFYLDATELEADLRAAHASAWAVVALGDRHDLPCAVRHRPLGQPHDRGPDPPPHDQLSELARISAQNEALRTRVEAASQRVSETNERYMRRVSAELHDGPAQALALASLRLDALMRRAGVAPGDPEAQMLARHVSARRCATCATSAAA